MKIEVGRKALLEVLSSVQGFTANKNAEAILQQAKLIALTDSELQVYATNLEVSVFSTLKGVNVEKTGEMLLPCQKAVQLLKESNEELVTLKTEGNFSILEMDGAKFSLNTGEVFKSEDFPSFENSNENPLKLHFVKVNTKRFEEMLAEVSFCTAKESSRYTLNGILFNLTKGNLSLVATDGKRLGFTSESVEYVNDEIKSIIPEKAVALLKSIPSKKEETKISFEPNNVWIDFGDTIIKVKLLEGRFPKYSDVIPKTRSILATFNTKELGHKMKQASLLANEKSAVVVMNLKKDRLELSAKSSGVGEASVSVNATYSGDETTIGINPFYMIDVLKSYKKDEISFSIKNEDTAVVTEDGALLYLIMPVSLKG